MSDEPILFGFGRVSNEDIEKYPLKFISHHRVGLNPADLKYGLWSTKEEAITAFASDFEEVAQSAKDNFLFVRLAPKLKLVNNFEGTNGWQMFGRFSIAKLKEKNG